MRGALWLLIAALALSEVGVQAKHPFPNPLEDPAGCGREGVSSSHVCDPELLLSSEGADRVDLMARALSSGGGPVVLVGPLPLQHALATEGVGRLLVRSLPCRSELLASLWAEGRVIARVWRDGAVSQTEI